VGDLSLKGDQITLRGESTRLYRAVSDAELEDILRFGFRPGAGTMETKLFTTSAEDAAFFARNILFPLDQKPLTIVEVEIPDSLVSRLFHFTTDGKTTIAVERNLLSEFNAAGIQPLHFAPLLIP
jgi:hypothetical protein